MSQTPDNRLRKSKTDVPAEPQLYKPAVAESSDPGRPREIGGREGPEPVRYGDWEKNGRCIDF